MYKPVTTYKTIYLQNLTQVHPVASLEDGCGGVAHIIEDDHCYVIVLYHADEGHYRYSPYIFPEAFKVMRDLPELTPA